ncbi:hypothetical protein QK899_13750 [Pseudomonas sp. AR5]|uniref:ORC-CDC6 family AAA ATPase n=1 Tax=Stutzerimonas balearica TaxID=74829 RepID=UPI00279E408C|nr:hypothetical protein [Stutzerimonas balearica]WIX01582.1 hypothetical protein QK899_13750 [Pseudomonas sp. AR5]
MIQDPKVMAAVSRIMQRSERQTDSEKLINTYVDVGLLPQLNNHNHQIFYGRRGTGKTHVMKVLESSFRAERNTAVLYVDCRTLGSTSQFTDRDIPIGRRCIALFRDYLLLISGALLEYIVENPSDAAEEALRALDEFNCIVTDPVVRKFAQSVSEGGRLKTEKGGQLSLHVDAASEGVSAGGNFEIGAGSESESSFQVEYAVENEDKIVFPDLHKCLNKVLKYAGGQLVILIDEWSSLPSDVQPYLAEFIKKGILPVNEATVKISALEYRCRFSESAGGNAVGFELGADIATAPDLDDYFVYDRNPDFIADIYSSVLYKHINVEFEQGYLEETYGVTCGTSLMGRLFTGYETFVELSRSCEGVVRDLINIFTKAFFDAQRRGRNSIDRLSVLESARQWFEQDKAQYLGDDLQNALRAMVDEVIGQRKARSFLLPRELERHPVVQRLFDARVIHHMQRGYADKDNPGARYNIYTIDYGTYVDLIGTSKQPQLGFLEDCTETDIVVPFDDKRSIRRIILRQEILDRYIN